MAKIEPFPGAALPSVEVEQEIVDSLEYLLAETKQGHIHGLAVVALYEPHIASKGWHYNAGQATALLGHVTLLQRELTDHIVQASQLAPKE